MKRLIILGAGGNASDILDIVDAINARGPAWDVAGLLDDGALGAGINNKMGIPILGGLKDSGRFVNDCWFVNSIGSDRNHMRREMIVAGAGIPVARFVELVHPAASISRRAVMGPGTYACCGVSVGGQSAIGSHVHLGAGCLIGHDTVVGDYAVVAPGAAISGFVKLGRGCYVGAGAKIRQSLTIGDGALIGMGAVVVKDVAAGTTVVGSPARVFERRL